MSAISSHELHNSPPSGHPWVGLVTLKRRKGIRENKIKEMREREREREREKSGAKQIKKDRQFKGGSHGERKLKQGQVL